MDSLIGFERAWLNLHATHTSDRLPATFGTICQTLLGESISHRPLCSLINRVNYNMGECPFNYKVIFIFCTLLLSRASRNLFRRYTCPWSRMRVMHLNDDTRYCNCRMCSRSIIIIIAINGELSTSNWLRKIGGPLTNSLNDKTNEPTT